MRASLVTDDVLRDRVMAGVNLPDSPLIRDVLAYARELYQPYLQKFAETKRR
jgi:hypothetical protein